MASFVFTNNYDCAFALPKTSTHSPTEMTSPTSTCSWLSVACRQLCWYLPLVWTPLFSFSAKALSADEFVHPCYSDGNWKVEKKPLITSETILFIEVVYDWMIITILWFSFIQKLNNCWILVMKLICYERIPLHFKIIMKRSESKNFTVTYM